MSENDVCALICCAVIPILMAIIMAFVLTWQRIGFLKQDNTRYSEKLGEAKSTIHKLESRVRELEYDVKRLGK